MMLLSRIFLIEFGVFLATAVALLARQVGHAWRWRRLTADEWVLTLGAVATCGAYGFELVREWGKGMPGVSRGWVMLFGASCAVHVGMKAVRVLRGKGDTDGRRSA